MKKRMFVLALAGVFLVLSLLMGIPSAGAEVVDQSPYGFTTRSTAVIAAPPATVYVKLVDDVGKWWNPEHTYSKNAANLTLEGRAGGLFLERLPDGGGVLHFTVTNAQPGKLLRMFGAMGPLQPAGVAGSLTWELKPEGEVTRVDLVYVVGGYYPGGMEKIGPLADKVLGELLGRLKAYIEKK